MILWFPLEASEKLIIYFVWYEPNDTSNRWTHLCRVSLKLFSCFGWNNFQAHLSPFPSSHSMSSLKQWLMKTKFEVDNRGHQISFQVAPSTIRMSCTSAIAVPLPIASISVTTVAVKLLNAAVEVDSTWAQTALLVLVSTFSSLPPTLLLIYPPLRFSSHPFVLLLRPQRMCDPSEPVFRFRRLHQHLRRLHLPEKDLPSCATPS